MLAIVCSASLASAAPEPRGAAIYAEKCLLCHQPTGLGAPPIFPPLAESEWLATKREAAIKAVCVGLAGAITVRGQSFDNVMPPQVLDDAQVADVLTYVGAAWGNQARAFSAEEVAKVRATTRFKTYDVGILLFRSSVFVIIK